MKIRNVKLKSPRCRPPSRTPFILFSTFNLVETRDPRAPIRKQACGPAVTKRQLKSIVIRSSNASNSGAAPATAQAKSTTMPEPQTRKPQSQSSLDALRRDSAATSKDSALKEVFFEFDRYDLTSQSRATLKAAADWLKKNPATKVEIEGHCDDRGTSEYNLALGAKRANAAKDYLTSLGVAEGRVSTTSYGEEIPVCREETEACWQKNRRDRFVAGSTKPGV